MLHIFPFASYFLPSVQSRAGIFQLVGVLRRAGSSAQSCPQVRFVPEAPSRRGPGHSCTAGALPPGGSQHALPAGEEGEGRRWLSPRPRRRPEGDTSQSALGLLGNLQGEADERIKAIVLLLVCYEFTEPETPFLDLIPHKG